MVEDGDRARTWRRGGRGRGEEGNEGMETRETKAWRRGRHERQGQQGAEEPNNKRGRAAWLCLVYLSRGWRKRQGQQVAEEPNDKTGQSCLALPRFFKSYLSCSRYMLKEGLALLENNLCIH
jgi:hypothetical protein